MLSYQHTATMVIAVICRTQSGMHSPSGLEASSRNSEGSYHTSAIEQNLCHLLRSVSCMGFSTQLYSSCTLNWVGATLQLPIPNVVAKTQLLSLVQWAQMLWLSFLAICRQSSSPWCAATARASSCTKILLTLRMRHVAIVLNYSVKNIRNKVRQKWKIVIEHTSVGLALAHACPT